MRSLKQLEIENALLRSRLEKAARDLKAIAHETRDPNTAGKIWTVVGRLEKEGK